jgi:hypothetical protein
MAAVAESATTTRCREEPNRANSAVGISMVWRPVITGVPEIFVWPITSGMAMAASVIPARISAGI